jgi:hypothetical protein
MNEYNFNVLTWGEFEEFTKDLLSEEMGVNRFRHSRMEQMVVLT